MYYDKRTRSWSQRYEPHKCFRRCCSRFCPIRNRELSKKCGNVYYDLKTTRIWHDETFFLSSRGEVDDVDAEMKEFLAYIENSTDTFAAQVASPLVKEIHKRLTEVKQI